MLRGPLLVGLPCLVATTITAQEQPARSQLDAAFTSLVSGDQKGAQSAFEAAVSAAPDGSQERWLALQLSKLSREVTSNELPRQPFDSSALKGAFALCLEGKPLEAQAAFLVAAVNYPQGSPERALAKKLAKVAEAQEAGLAAPALTPNNPIDQPSAAESNAGGTSTMIFTGAALGVGGGILLDVDFEIPGAGALAIPLGTGIVGGLGGYIYTKKKHPEGYTFERAGAVAVGAMLGTAEGILISSLNEGALIQNGLGGDITYLSAITGTIAGVAVSELRPGDRGDAFLVFSSALWATVFAAEGLGLVIPENGIAATLTTGFNLGIAGGVAAAMTRPISYRRLRIINEAGILGTAAGALMGGIIALLVEPANAENSARLVVGGAMAGSIGGLTTGYLLTQKLAPTPTPEIAKGNTTFQGLSLGVAQGNTNTEAPLTFNAHFTF